MRRSWFVRWLVSLMVASLLVAGTAVGTLAGLAGFAGLVGPGPALAASSASEVLNSDGARPLAGPTRYDTAALIAQEFVDHTVRQDGFAVSAAVVVSGESFPDALSAAALAGRLRAPILLTPPGALAGVVSSFITRNNINNVHIVGGVAAVSQAVADALAGLTDVTVTRVSGDDRYRTAVAVAQQVGGAAGADLSAYCNTTDQTVLLANGEGFADALSGGPLAYSGPHPTLLTPPEGLPDSVLEYLDAAGVKRVVILGGPAAIPAAIDQQITSRGIQITRLAGADRFETATQVAAALTSGVSECGWLIQDFGLANGRSPYDALAGSALLGERQNPLLLTETSSLPQATASYLRSTPQQRDGELTNIKLQVLGGTATVTQSVVNQAVSQAINQGPVGEPISGEVVGYPNEFRFIVNFAEEADELTAVERSSYLIDGAELADKYTLTYYPADPNADNPKAHVLVDLCCVRLAAGSVITVKPDTIRAAGYTTGDNRFVAGITYTVPATRPLP